MKIVETNVAIAANGRNTHAGLECQLAAVEFLIEIYSRRQMVVLDENGEILAEYAKYLNYSGQPAVGDWFFKYLHDNQYYGDRVFRVATTPVGDEGRGYMELPENNMDPSDRKFLVLAVVSGADVCNALDTDWYEKRGLMEALGVNVVQLCPEHGCNLG